MIDNSMTSTVVNSRPSWLFYTVLKNLDSAARSSLTVLTDSKE